jgi:hypothetical protein
MGAIRALTLISGQSKTSNRRTSNPKLIAESRAEKPSPYRSLIHRMVTSPPKVLFVLLVGAGRPDA